MGLGLPLVLDGPLSELSLEVLLFGEAFPLLSHLLDLSTLSLQLGIIEDDFSWLFSEGSSQWLTVDGDGSSDALLNDTDSFGNSVLLAPGGNLVFGVHLAQELLGLELDVLGMLLDSVLDSPLLELLVNLLLLLELDPVGNHGFHFWVDLVVESGVVEVDSGQGGGFFQIQTGKWLAINLGAVSDDVSDVGESSLDVVCLGPLWDLVLGNQLVGELFEVSLGSLDFLLVRVDVGFDLLVQLVFSGELLPLSSESNESASGFLHLGVIELDGREVDWLRNIHGDSNTSQIVLKGLNQFGDCSLVGLESTSDLLLEASLEGVLGALESVQAGFEVFRRVLGSPDSFLESVDDISLVGE